MSLCDDKQTMPLPYLDSSLYWTKKKRKKEERSICILEKRGLEKPPVHAKNGWLWRSEMWHHATNKSQSLKGYTLVFFFCSLWTISCTHPHPPHTHTSPAAIRCLSSMYPSTPYLPSRPRIPLSPSAYHRADRQRWGRNDPSAVEVCSSE